MSAEPVTEYIEYEVVIHAMVTAPSVEEAYAALRRSGLRPDALIGEVLIEQAEVQDDK